jgi:hypothetical protein
MRSFLVNFAGCAAMAFVPIHGKADDDLLKNKIVCAALNHSQSAMVKVGTNGVTSLEFPYKIEAIDGFGFSQTPSSADAFQISYTKGTNYFSVRALKPGVSGNLTVVLDEKVYSFFFAESSNPSFVNIFGAPGSLADGDGSPAEKKIANPTQLAELLDKVKKYPTLKSGASILLNSLQVAEPEKKIQINDQIELTIHRVLKDDSLNAVALEVEIVNQSMRDFLYDPQEVKIRTENRVFDSAMEEATGLVKAKSSSTIYLVINQTKSDQENNLRADSDFQLEIKEAAEAKPDALTFNQPPSDYLPTAITNGSAVEDLNPPLATGNGAAQSQAAITALKRTGPKKSGKKPEPKQESISKESVAKTQKPPLKKLFGWL